MSFDIEKVAVRGDYGENVELFKNFFKGFRSSMNFQSSNKSYYFVEHSDVKCTFEDSTDIFNKIKYNSIQEAIAARDNENFVLPTHWYCKPTNKEDAFVLAKWFDENKERGPKSSNFYQSDLEAVIRNGLSNNKWGYCKNKDHKEITFEQFKKYVLKNKNEKRFPFELKPKDAQKIIDIACSTWKSKLARTWGEQIVQRNNIDIVEQEYNDMRKACTPEQNLLFDNIFGKDISNIKPELGQIWKKNDTGNYYIISCAYTSKYSIIYNLNNIKSGKLRWSANILKDIFNDEIDKFTYIGKAEDVISINE